MNVITPWPAEHAHSYGSPRHRPIGAAWSPWDRAAWSPSDRAAYFMSDRAV